MRSLLFTFLFVSMLSAQLVGTVKFINNDEPAQFTILSEEHLNDSAKSNFSVERNGVRTRLMKNQIEWIVLDGDTIHQRDEYQSNQGDPASGTLY